MTETETIHAFENLLSWFKSKLEKEMTAKDHLLDGCPNHLQGDIESARKALVHLKGTL